MCDFNYVSYLMEQQQLWNCVLWVLAEYWQSFVHIRNGNTASDTLSLPPPSLDLFLCVCCSQWNKSCSDMGWKATGKGRSHYSEHYIKSRLKFANELEDKSLNVWRHLVWWNLITIVDTGISHHSKQRRVSVSCCVSVLLQKGRMHFTKQIASRVNMWKC